MAHDTDQETGTKKPRKRSVLRLFKNESSNEFAGRAGLDCEAIIFRAADGSWEERVDLADYFPDGLPGPCVGRAAAAFGLNTSIGNAANTASDVSEQEAILTRIEVLQGNKWASDAIGGGARPSILLEAVRRFRVKHKRPVHEDAMAEVKAKLEDEETAKMWSKHAEIVEFLHEIRLERAKAAGGPSAESIGLLD